MRSTAGLPAGQALSGSGWRKNGSGMNAAYGVDIVRKVVDKDD